MTDAVPALDQAAAAAGSWYALAKRLGVKHQVVYRWRAQGFVPAKRALQLEVMYGIPARELVNPALAEFADLISV